MHDILDGASIQSFSFASDSFSFKFNDHNQISKLTLIYTD